MSEPQTVKLFGHPVGLFTLFFAEMWERFSFYGMRALLTLYMVKGFLEYGDSEAALIYGAYGSLVYATPFVGGVLADRILGCRRSVILGGALMAFGHLLMGVETEYMFFLALAFLIVGNGFFKPNISTMVGSLYEPGSGKRDAGFTLFYMGVNLGAALAPLLCGYIGQHPDWGWHYGFGLATVGMMAGLAIFITPQRMTQVIVALGSGTLMIGLFYCQNNNFQLAWNMVVGLYLVVAGIVSIMAIGREGLPDDCGAPPDPEKLKAPLLGPLSTELTIYMGVLFSIPAITWLVQNKEVSGWVLLILGGAAFIYVAYQAIISDKVARERLMVVLILTFFSMLFWAFFEQAGTSINLFTDRNIDRVSESRVITPDDIGQTLTIQVNQEQLGYPYLGEAFTMSVLDELRENKEDTVDWVVTEEHVGMGIEGDETPASVFQSVNPIFILIFGLPFSALWGFLGARGQEPSTPVKFALGLLQLGLGFGALWYGVETADARGMVWIGWLVLGYLLHTTGELCLSPVGLSMVTKLSPEKMVSAVMGLWFLATAFSHFLAGQLAALTGVHHEEGAENVIPIPLETLGIYGDIFGKIGIAAVASAVICFVLAPLLTRWMHVDHEGE